MSHHCSTDSLPIPIAILNHQTDWMDRGIEDRGYESGDTIDGWQHFLDECWPQPISGFCARIGEAV
jgi:hypothetical protein